MAKVNVKRNPIYTHEGAVAKRINPEQQLKRSVMACMLWENTFYESGVSIAERIASFVPKVNSTRVAMMAIEAREKMKLRHAPLLLLRELARFKGTTIAKTLTRVIQRPDEITEFLAMYWKDGKCPLSAQVKKGLAGAFNKFDEYALAKYNRDGKVKLRDALFLSHAKPADAAQSVLFKKLVDNTLAVPDTWEVGLSAGGNKKEIFTRLLKEGKLGALALLRNLRNMEQANVDRTVIKDALSAMKVDRVLPFRFIAAARYAPYLEPQLEDALFRCIAGKEKLPGRTVLLIDVSGSMESEISGKSQMTRMEAACGIGMLARELCDDAMIMTFSNELEQVPPRKGFALSDAIVRSQPHGGTYLGNAVRVILSKNRYIDRIIVITDEQSHDRVPDPGIKNAYMINVGSYKNGVGYGPWTHIDGFSEAVLDYIVEFEKHNDASV